MGLSSGSPVARTPPLIRARVRQEEVAARITAGFQFVQQAETGRASLRDGNSSSSML